MDIVDILKNYFYYKEFPLDSEEYGSTLDVELTLSHLMKKGLIKPNELLILKYFLCGFSFRKIGSMLNLDRKSVSRKLKRTILLVKYEYNT